MPWDHSSLPTEMKIAMINNAEAAFIFLPEIQKTQADVSRFPTSACVSPQRPDSHVHQMFIKLRILSTQIPFPGKRKMP